MAQESRTEKRFEQDDEFTFNDVREAFAEHDRVRIARGAVEATLDSWENRATDMDEMGALMLASDYNGFSEQAVLYDPETELYAVVSGNKRSDSMNNAEYDWKVRSIGSRLTGDTDSSDFESDEDAEEWLGWFIGECIKYDNVGGLHSMKHGSPSTVTVADGYQWGLKTDTFDVTLRAE